MPVQIEFISWYSPGNQNLKRKEKIHTPSNFLFSNNLRQKYMFVHINQQHTVES